MTRARESRQTLIVDPGSQAATPRRVDVWMLPADRGNPYQALLCDALAKRGGDARTASRLRLRHALTADNRSTVIHLHWLEFISHSTAAGRLAAASSVARAMHLLIVLLVARLRRIRIVWTVHNLQPHEARRPWLDRLLGRAVARLADSVLSHSRHCAAQISKQLRRTHVEIAYHGNYIGFYPPPCRDRDEIRLALGVPLDAHVVLAFGLIRPYKKIVELIEEFQTIDSPHFRLLIVGHPLTDEIARQVKAAAAEDPRVILKLERVPDAEVTELHRASDVAVLAYRDLFSSGALMLALSLGLPVVAPESSTATELGAAPAIQGFAPGRLAEALAASAPTDAAARNCASDCAAGYRWDEMAAKVLAARGRHPEGWSD